LFLPQRQDLVEKYGDKYGTTYDTLVYNGPFKITELQGGNKIVMVKNDSYWDKNSVKLSKVTMPFMKDANSRMNALQSGEIDTVGVDMQEWVDKFKQLGKFDQIVGDQPNTYFDFYNTATKYFKNAKIRRAFSLALDREDYFKLIAKGIGKPAYSWVPYSMQIGNDVYRSKVPEQLKSDKEDPKQLLAEGLKEIGADVDPSKMVIDYLLPGTDVGNKEQGDYMLNVLKTKLGVTVKCNYMEWAQYLAQIDKGGYDMCFTDWVGDYNDPMTFFDMWETGAKIENNGWSNKDYDALIEDAKNTMDQSKRLEDFKKAEKILLQDEAILSPSYFQGKNEFIAKYVKDTQAPLFAMGKELKYAYTSGRGK
jgi:oligopeptide transport system substrate-binding protein